MSTIQLPAVRVRRRTFLFWAIVVIVSTLITIDSLRTFVVDEQALLTQSGRQRRRTRRRKYRKQRLCDEGDEPRPFNVFSNWRRLLSCVEYDLSLRRRQLGDNGVRRLVGHLGRREYASEEHKGQLRVLNLEGQGITRRGVGYLARWIASDPIESDDIKGLVDVERIPTAAANSIFINLEGNPIGPLGVKDLERAVSKARANGIKVVIIGGGSTSDIPEGGKADHVFKLGPLIYTRKALDMKPWRLPVPLRERLLAKAKSRPLPFVTLRVVLALFVGLVVGRISRWKLPYRIVILRRE
mmetsp:Transcript_3618/g.6298  ORF Transcript_3618/g.6298 Transcript_3618/m.6298 type:complete len:298 (-) Transcript_3618:53-946(-)